MTSTQLQCIECSNVGLKKNLIFFPQEKNDVVEYLFTLGFKCNDNLIPCWSEKWYSYINGRYIWYQLHEISFIHIICFLSFSSRNNNNLDYYFKTKIRWFDIMIDGFAIESHQCYTPIMIKLFYCKWCDSWTQCFQVSLTFISFQTLIILMIFRFFLIIMNIYCTYDYELWLCLGL